MAEKRSPNYQILDSWRGFASLWVVSFHGYNIFADRQNFFAENLPLLEWIVTKGWFGVHLFFVISGYCVATNLSTALNKKRSAGVFLRDRLLRIFPVYWCALIAQTLLQLASTIFNRTPWLETIPANPWEALANFFLLEPYLGVQSRLLVSWSLVYEWGFYFLMAAGLLYLQTHPRRLIAFLGGVALALVGLLGYYTGIFLPLKFWPEFMIGVCVFSFYQAGPDPAKACLVTPLFMFPIVLWLREGSSERAGMMFGAAVFGLLLCLLRKWDDVLISIKPLQWLKQVGLFSYSLYLVHVPFGGAFRNLCMRFFSEATPWFLVVQTGYVIFCLVVALVFYWLVEAPWERFRKTRFH